MKTGTLPFMLFLFLIKSVLVSGQKVNTSFQPGKVWFDKDGDTINCHAGGILIYNDKYYWYGQVMVKGKTGSDAQVGVSCYSSSDLYNWKSEGVVLKVFDEPMHYLAMGCKIERPKVIYNELTGKFVMWFHHDILGQGHKNALTGVAVSDRAAGPFTLIKIFRPNANYWPVNAASLKDRLPRDNALRAYSGGDLPEHPDSLNILARDFHRGQMARDMTLFVDDDGKAYHIYSSEENSTLHISLLTDDYLSPSGKYARVFVNRFMEAPTIFKKDGKYYMINSGCTGWAPNEGRSAVAESIWGPWTELGNPFKGKDSEISLNSQGTFILKVPGMKDAFIYIGDRWVPDNPVDGTSVWLPLKFSGGSPVIEWVDKWDLGYLGKNVR